MKESKEGRKKKARKSWTNVHSAPRDRLDWTDDERREEHGEGLCGIPQVECGFLLMGYLPQHSVVLDEFFLAYDDDEQYKKSKK